MKFRTLLVVMIGVTLQSSFAQDKSGVSTRTSLPGALLALQVDASYSAAFVQAAKDIANAAASKKCFSQTIDPASLVIVGFEASDNFREYFEGREISLFLGAPTRRWPTSIIEVGRIRARANTFPDGVEGFRISETARFELSCNKALPVER